MAVTESRVRSRHLRGMLTALLLSAAYYGAVKLAFALALDSEPVSILRPATAVLLVGLFLTRPQDWGLFLLAAFPAHWAGYWRSGASIGMVLGWFAGNCGAAILGVALVRRILGKRPRFDHLRHVIVFVFCCGFLAPFVASLLDQALARMLEQGAGRSWPLCLMPFFSDVAAVLILVPALLTGNPGALPSMGWLSLRRRLEIGLLALAGIGGVAFLFVAYPADLAPVALYALLPVLLWIALRFGPSICSVAYLLFAGFTVLSLLRGALLALDGNAALPQALSLQVFLIGTSISLLLLAAAKREGRKSQACFSRLFQLNPDAISVSAGINGRILEVNERWQSLFGYPRREAIGNTPQQLGLFASEKDGAALAERSKEKGCIRGFEVEMRSKDGGALILVLSGEKADIGGESGFITILQDVTALRKAENELRKQREQLIHLSRIALLGKLSGAFAHELKQPLAAILGNALAARRIMNMQRVDLHEVREIVDDIADEGKRAGEVIQRLRALFMKGEPRVQLLEINELVRNTLALAHGTLQESKVMVSLELGPDPGVVRGDRVQLQQVLLNLIVNADESMSGSPPASRRLKLSTDNDKSGHVRIAVSDTGPGIAPDAIDKVFDAFFTTKTYGTGFGLSISHAIIAAHGGYIEAANDPGGGAIFRVILPAYVGVSS